MKPDKPILQRNPVVWYGPNHGIEIIDMSHWRLNCGICKESNYTEINYTRKRFECPICGFEVEKSTDLFDFTIMLAEIQEWIWSQRIGIRDTEYQNRMGIKRHKQIMANHYRKRHSKAMEQINLTSYYDLIGKMRNSQFSTSTIGIGHNTEKRKNLKMYRKSLE